MSEAGPQDQPDDATVDLLVKQVTEGLSPAEQRELDVLDSALTGAELREFERAAAAVSLAAPVQALPAGLRASLLQQAESFGAGTPKVVSLASARAVAVQPVSRGGNLGWFAAAACLLLALFAWFRTPPATPALVVEAPVAPPVAAPLVPAPHELSPAEAREALMAKADTLKITLGATKDPGASGVTGDVVWDPETQKGFVRFAGLAANDPKVHQYQIWIFDGARDKRYPVDGGVFDVPADTGEIVIPIRAELIVHKPAAFAVTIERPGGAVVSAREHVLALGAAG